MPKQRTEKKNAAKNASIFSLKTEIRIECTYIKMQSKDLDQLWNFVRCFFSLSIRGVVQ